MMTKTSTKILVLIPMITIALITGTSSQVMAIGTNDGPSVKVKSVIPQSHGFDEVNLSISSGNEDLIAGKILVTSDVSSKEVNHDAVSSGSTTNVRIVIKAIDSSSIDAKLIKIDDKPTAKLLEVVPLVGGESNIYMVTVKVTTGSEDIQNVKLLLKSDMESFSVFASAAGKSPGNVGAFEAYSHGLTMVNMYATDSESVSVKLVSYDMR